MCFPHTPASIKALAAFCFCVNMFNLIYLFMRYHGLLPPDALFIKQEIETVIPDVKNLDKYLPRRDGTVFLTSLAGISVVFDFILYAGVERQPGMILSAWLWGVIDCSLDAAIGIASGNFTFMDSLAREREVIAATEPLEKSLFLYRKMYGNATTQHATLTTIATDEGPRSNDTEYARARKASAYRKTYGNSSMLRTFTTTSAIKYGHPTMYIPSRKVQVVDETSATNTTAYRLTEEQISVLVLYVIFRLIFKLFALAGIKDYASYVIGSQQRRYLETTQETTMKESTETHTQLSTHGFSGPVPTMVPPFQLAPLPPEPLAPPPGPIPHLQPPPLQNNNEEVHVNPPGFKDLTIPHLQLPPLLNRNEEVHNVNPPGFKELT